MTDTVEIRKRVRRAIEQAKREAVARRQGAAAAAQAATTVLTTIATPLCKTIASALKAEGYPFHASTPAGTVRLSSETVADDYVELTLDTTRHPPALMGHVSRAWGNRILVEEHVVTKGRQIGDLSEEELLDFLLKELLPFIER